MGRTLRLFASAAAMLVVAVGVAAFLKDEPGYKAGSSEISGKLVGLTAFQEDKAELSSSGTAEDDRTQKPLPSAVRADNEAAPDTKLLKNDGRGAISAPFDTRPASVETDSAEEPPSAALARQAEEPEKKTSRSVTSSVVRDGSASAAGKKSEAEQSSGQESREKQPSEAVQDRDGKSSGGNAAGTQARENAQEKSSSEDGRSGQPYERVVTSAKFSMQGSQIKLTLQGNAPMVGHYFTLEKPDRVVLDLAGNWEIDVPRVPSNRLIEAVRVGQHDDKTRVVFDMKTTGKVALVPLNRNALELCIQ